MSIRTILLEGLLLAVSSALVFVAVVVLSVADRPKPTNESLAVAPGPPPSEATPERVQQICGSCHAFPPPDSFPRWAWRREIKQAYDFFRDSELQTHFPSLESVALYYENRAPTELPLRVPSRASGPPPLRFEPHGYALPGDSPDPAVTNVNLVHLFDKRKLDVLVCDSRHDQVLVLQPYVDPPTWKVLGKVPAPAHAEVVDLDGDGIPDIVVACLGNFFATNDRVGSVVWLRGAADGSFTPYTLLDHVGRVADVQAADFIGKGKLDLLVAVFGWNMTGEITLLENRTTDGSHPVFVPRILDERHGAIHVPVCDLNGDGRPDFVALISQEHERVVAFLNEGGGRFREQTIYAAPHPAYGSSGIQLVDMNGDGKLDVLYTNGDVLDRPYLLKPYHGVQWLENRGTFPFVHHPLTAMYGAMRAVAADLRRTGRPDIVAVSFLPEEKFPQRDKLGLESVVLLAQTTPGRFDRHAVETVHCDHFTCAVGDLDGDGKLHLVTGSFFLEETGRRADAVTIWRNLGPPPARP
jgi:hypothetical protein